MAELSPNLTDKPSDAGEARERDVITVVQELVRELRRGKPAEVSLASRLDRDLGIDSLGRTELVLRLERAFGVRMSTQAIGEAETVRDLLKALGGAGAEPQRVPAAAPVDAQSAVVGTPSEARTLVEMLEWHVAQHPDRLHVTLFQDDLSVLGTMTYRQLADAARRVAAGLIERDILPGDRIALMLPTSLEFFSAFLGILYAGAVPVPIYPPARPSQIEDHLRRQAGILRNAGARILVTVPEGLRLAGILKGQVDTLDAVETVARLNADPSRTPLPPVTDGAATAFIQYTSGSTGDPKGVVLSHANLLANVRSMISALQATSVDIFVSWLPLYHDLGLIGAWMGSLYCAVPLYVTSPLSFLVRPECWLKAFHRFGGTLSAAPNFAYELCLNKIPDSELEGLDLSSWRVVANGAEPISPRTLRRFIEKFGRYGFRPTAMSPVYGLAENSVGLTFPPLGRGPLVERIDREALMVRGRAELARPDDPNALEIVACGHPLPDNEIRIVDELGREVGERIEGRLEFRGPSQTSGYFGNEAKSRELFHDGWVNSGDRAYMAGGDVFITGRVKDIIIRAGRNIYPHEVESAVGEVPGMRKGGVAVFGTTDEASGTERLVTRSCWCGQAPCRRRPAARCAEARPKSCTSAASSGRGRAPCGGSSPASGSPASVRGSPASAALSATCSMGRGGGPWLSSPAPSAGFWSWSCRGWNGGGRSCEGSRASSFLRRAFRSRSRASSASPAAMRCSCSIMRATPIRWCSPRFSPGRRYSSASASSPGSSLPARCCAGWARCSSSATTLRPASPTRNPPPIWRGKAE